MAFLGEPYGMEHVFFFHQKPERKAELRLIPKAGCRLGTCCRRSSSST
ncbi:MAG: hypothetical protein R3B47_12215 [Bacteroidia bacterium]